MFCIIVLKERSHLFFQLKLIRLEGRKGSGDAALQINLSQQNKRRGLKQFICSCGAWTALAGWREQLNESLFSCHSPLLRAISRLLHYHL